MSVESSLVFNNRGNLTPGIIKNVSLDDFRDFFIDSDSFIDSITRERNYKGFTHFIEELKRNNIFDAFTKVWLDGSFVTNKLDPKDIDLVIFLDATNPATQRIMQNTHILRDVGVPCHCDPYFVVDYKTVPESVPQIRGELEANQKYWMGQFCFDRNEDPKGIIELTKEKLQ